jgi:hypothetical protein
VGETCAAKALTANVGEVEIAAAQLFEVLQHSLMLLVGVLWLSHRPRQLRESLSAAPAISEPSADSEVALELALWESVKDGSHRGGMTFEDLGDQLVKNIAHPVGAFSAPHRQSARRRDPGF